MLGKCKLTILIADMNDNHSQISIKSFQSPIKEDIALDMVIAIISVNDKDSEENGQIDVHINDNLPFRLKQSANNYYELVVSEPLDRENVLESIPFHCDPCCKRQLGTPDSSDYFFR